MLSTRTLRAKANVETENILSTDAGPGLSVDRCSKEELTLCKKSGSQ